MTCIFICGTPGTGKSTLVQNIKNLRPQLNYINVSDFARQSNCQDGYDHEVESIIIDEDKLEAQLTPVLKDASRLHLLESIHADLVDKNLIASVYVTRCENSLLFDRLTARNYKGEKLKQNLECEIFQLILDESVDYFGRSKVVQLNSNTKDDLESNTKLIVKRIDELLEGFN